MKKILLVFPRAHESVWDMRLALAITGKKAFIPPLGLATVAALTPGTYEVAIVDEAVAPVDYATPCDMVGVAGYTFNAPRMLEIADAFRARGVMAVAGGPFCRTDPAACREHFDVVFTGEVERTWPRFLRDWEQGCPAPHYAEEDFIGMETSPPPRWDLVDLGRYTSGIVQTTRGCVYDCEFCDVVALMGRKARAKSPDAAIGEVRALMDRGVSTIWLADDNFTANIGYAKGILARLAALNGAATRKARFITQITAEKAMDGELLSLLAAANVYAVLIGIESPNPASLAETGKHQNLQSDLAETVRTVHAAGIYVVGGLVVGFDADDTGIFDAHERFIRTSGLMLTVVSMLKASKGTRLWKRLRETGRLRGEDDGDYYSASNFTPLRMSAAELAAGYEGLLRRIFTYGHFLARFGMFAERLPPLRDPGTAGVSAEDLRTGLRAAAYFLFRAGPAGRRFFLTGMWKGASQGFRGMAAFVELAVWFESHRLFLLREKRRNEAGGTVSTASSA